MSTTASIQRVRMYLSEADRHEGQALYLVILARLRRDGATGASALRGLAGFGPRQRIGFGNSAIEQNPPVIIEWIDRSERIERLLPSIAELAPDALITVEAIQVYRAILRNRGPLAVDLAVDDLMTSAPTLTATSLASEALDLLAAGHRTVAILHEDGALGGTVTAQDLAWRAGFHVPASVLPLLTADETITLLASLNTMSVEQIMNREPRSVIRSAALPQALVTMAEWGLDEIPVVDRDGRFCGQIVDRALLELAAHPREAEEQVRDAEPDTLVSLIMQTSVAQVSASQSLAAALTALLAAPGRSVLVTDAANRLQGQINAETALARLDGEERAAFLAALQRPEATLTTFAGADRGLEELLESTMLTVAPATDLISAARQLLSSGSSSLPVVDDDRHLLGAVTRRALLRALLV